MLPIAIDLFCGLGGWTEGFLAEGYDVIGFDIERHDYGTGGYPGQLVIQDVLTLHGSQFKDAAVIVASPPCQKYSYMAMPWSRAKALAAWYREDESRIKELNALFDACFRIAKEASVPLIVENVKGAQPWVGKAKYSYCSFYLWGDLPALMPQAKKFKNHGGSWFNIAHNTDSGHNPVHELAGRKIPASCGPRRWEDREIKRLRDIGTKQHGSGRVWFDKRKAASAQIAKIPFPLARHIASIFKP